MAKRKYSIGPAASIDSSDVESLRKAKFGLLSTDRGDDDPSLGAEYEVFLNFRGPDTRLNFTDCLYHAMDGAGIRVFRDNEEMRKGEVIEGELERAIKSSAICIPIFSKNYMSSAWCLRELTYMVDCKAMILPIFFDVEPKDVKLKTNLYQDALQKHREKFSCEDVQRWEVALVKVARMKGWDVKDTGHGELIKIIVAEVLIKLNKRDKKLPDQLVGIHDCVEEVVRLLDEGSHNVRYLVIHGMGGIGKTTLAKVVFNQMSSRFHGCSFLLNVREASRGGNVVQLQKQLLSEILNIKQVEISDCDAGSNQIERRFRNKKVLIVLDDLDKQDQLIKLAEKRDWFGLGSRIIITTRDTNFLPIKEENRENDVQTHFKEFTIYQMRELSHRHALKLFSKHAFRMDSPPHDYEQISRDIICKTGGLPLALEVIGSSLCGRSKPFWKGTLKKLDLVPNQDVCHKLMISFDMLEDAQKEIFLDIACYFIGEEKIHPHYMWKALDLSPKIEIPILSRMSLIKVDGNDILSMHDLLRDLGRDIVRQEDKFLEKRSRLWSPKDALNVVQHRKGTDNITALKLTGLPKEHNFTSEVFSLLPNLRLLELEGGNLTGDFKNLLSSLKWLSWNRCPSDLQAVNLCLGNLVVLKLSDSEILENWNGWGPCLANHDLKVLHLMRCYLSTTPDLSTCLNLRILVFVEHCPEATQIGSSIGKLEHLKRLEIIAARVQPSTFSGSPHFDLCAIPSTICRLKNLSSLKLQGLCMRELHPSIGGMTGLMFMSLNHCYRLRKLPDSIGKLRSLLELNMFNTRIRELPDSIGDLKRLEKMNLGHTRMRELPNSIGGLESLLDLDLQCTDIIALPASIGYLKRLRCLIAIDSKIRELPDSIVDLKRLEIMDLGGTQIRELPNSIGGLESLLHLSLFKTNITELPASIGYLKRLRTLEMYGSKIRELPKDIGMFENLTELAYRGSRNIDITWPPRLSYLCIFCDDPRSLPRLPLGLCNLELNGVKSPLEQPLLSELRCLHRLTLSRWGLRDIEFKLLENLSHLKVEHCKSLVRLSGLSSLRNVTNLKIYSCSQLIEIRDLGEMKSLEELIISECRSIERITDLSMHQLWYLGIDQCESLQGLPDLSKLHKLWRLELSHCKALQGVPAVPNTCRPDVHACPLLGEYGDFAEGCYWCEKSNPAICSIRPDMYA